MIDINEHDDSDEFFNSRKISEELMGNAVSSPNVLNVELGDIPIRDLTCTTLYILDTITVDALMGAKSLESFTSALTILSIWILLQEIFGANNLHRITLASK